MRLWTDNGPERSMQMPSSYLPAQDSALLTWMQTFAAGIAASPGLYQLMASDALAISSAGDGFAAAYAEAIDPGSRTPVSVNLKDTARNAAVQICRQYAAQ